MEKERYTRLTMEQGDLKVTWEVPYEDVSGEDVLDAINTIMIGMTFNQETIYSAMASWLSDRAYDKYEVIEKNDTNE